MANPFSDYGVSDADFEAELEGPEVLAAKIKFAKKVAAYWRRVSPELTGEYKDSVGVEVEGDQVYVRARDEKANIIEFGTEDTPEFAPRQRTQNHYGRVVND